MRHEPRAAVGAEIERPRKLVSAEALLRSCVKTEAEQLLMDRDMRPLHDRADAYRELLPAFATVIPARPL